jgi:hypothetical protein
LEWWVGDRAHRGPKALVATAISEDGRYLVPEKAKVLFGEYRRVDRCLVRLNRRRTAVEWETRLILINPRTRASRILARAFGWDRLAGDLSPIGMLAYGRSRTAGNGEARRFEMVIQPWCEGQ